MGCVVPLLLLPCESDPNTRVSDYLGLNTICLRTLDYNRDYCLKFPSLRKQLYTTMLSSAGEMRRCYPFVRSLVPCIYGPNFSVPAMCAGVYKFFYYLAEVLDWPIVDFALHWTPDGCGAWLVYAVVYICSWLWYNLARYLCLYFCACVFAALFRWNYFCDHCHRLHLFVVHVHAPAPSSQCVQKSTEKNHVDWWAGEFTSRRLTHVCSWCTALQGLSSCKVNKHQSTCPRKRSYLWCHLCRSLPSLVSSPWNL